VILIQTALPQEFAAVKRALQRAESSGVGSAERSTTLGQCAGHACCVLQTGVGLARTRQALQQWLDQHAPDRPTAVISIGLGGALVPGLTVGQTLWVASVAAAGQGTVFEPTMPQAAPGRAGSIPPWTPARLVSLASPAWSAAEKATLAASSGATLCDMETAAVAEWAAAHGVAWCGLRVVSDLANETLPRWVLKLPQHLEAHRWLRAAGLVASHPQDLLRLIRLAFRMQRLSRTLTSLTRDIVTAIPSP
jgi:nucleoside phosphorylase